MNRMPTRRVFTVCDPLAELKKHHANVVILRYTMAERPTFRRQRSQTVPSIGNAQLKNSSSITSSSQARGKHGPVRQTRSLEFMSPNKTRPRIHARGSFQSAAHTVSFSGTVGDTSKVTGKGFNGHRHSISHSKGPTVNLSREEPASASTRLVKSIPSGDKSGPIYSIVKARSLALKWYRGNNKLMTSSEAKRKKSEPLPTINDKETISLCQAKCSPQFAEVMHLLQNEDNTTAVENIEGGLSVLCLKYG